MATDGNSSGSRVPPRVPPRTGGVRPQPQNNRNPPSQETSPGEQWISQTRKLVNMPPRRVQPQGGGQPGTSPQNQRSTPQTSGNANGVEVRKRATDAMRGMEFLKTGNPKEYQRLTSDYRNLLLAMKAEDLDRASEVLDDLIPAIQNALKQLRDAMAQKDQGTTSTTTPSPSNSGQSSPTNSPRQQTDKVSPPVVPPRQNRGQNVPPQNNPQRQNAPQPRSRGQIDPLQAKQKFDAAKLAFENARRNPPSGKVLAKPTIDRLGSEALALVDDELSGEDDIQIKRRFLPDSKDSDYKKNITAPVTAAMQRAKALLANPAEISLDVIQELEEVSRSLDVHKAHYSDTSGLKEKDVKHLDQRRRKVTAIEDHQKAFAEITGKMRDILRAIAKAEAKPVLDLLATVPDHAAGDQQAGTDALKLIETALKDQTPGKPNPMRKALWQASEPENAEVLHTLLSSTDTQTVDVWANELATTRVGDTPFMDKMVDTSLKLEAPTQTLDTFFRANSVATKLATAHMQNSPGCQAFNKRFQNSMLAKLEGKGSLEVDPLKMTVEQYNKQMKTKKKTIDDSDRANLATHNATVLKDIAQGFIDDLLADAGNVPPEVAKIAASTYEEAMRVSNNDESFARQKIGAFLMLRLVNPMMINGASAKVAETSQSPNATQEDKSAAVDAQRMVVLQTKLLQNMSNNATFDKEEYMKPFNSLIVDRQSQDGLAPPNRKMQQFLKEIALQGQRLQGGGQQGGGQQNAPQNAPQPGGNQTGGTRPQRPRAGNVTAQDRPPRTPQVGETK